MEIYLYGDVGYDAPPTRFADEEGAANTTHSISMLERLVEKQSPLVTGQGRTQSDCASAQNVSFEGQNQRNASSPSTSSITPASALCCSRVRLRTNAAKIRSSDCSVRLASRQSKRSFNNSELSAQYLASAVEPHRCPQPYPSLTKPATQDTRLFHHGCEGDNHCKPPQNTHEIPHEYGDSSWQSPKDKGI